MSVVDGLHSAHTVCVIDAGWEATELRSSKPLEQLFGVEIHHTEEGHGEQSSAIPPAQ